MNIPEVRPEVRSPGANDLPGKEQDEGAAALQEERIAGVYESVAEGGQCSPGCEQAMDETPLFVIAEMAEVFLDYSPLQVLHFCIDIGRPCLSCLFVSRRVSPLDLLCLSVPLTVLCVSNCIPSAPSSCAFPWSWTANYRTSLDNPCLCSPCPDPRGMSVHGERNPKSQATRRRATRTKKAAAS